MDGSISNVFGFFSRGSVAGTTGSGAFDTMDRTFSEVLGWIAGLFEELGS